MYQPQVLAYLRHVVQKWDLRRDIILETALTSAQWNDATGQWTVETSTGVAFKARYLVTALGLLSKQNFPDIPGLDSFEGEKYHTGAWPEHIELKGKRIGVIGNGSTGVQVITALAKEVDHLISFQRNPQFSVPSGQGTVSKEYREELNANYAKVWDEVKESLFGFGFTETDRPTFSVSAEEREQIFEAAWQRGGGFRFMFETFGDISTNEEANNAAADFIKRKIVATVKDTDKARKLLPTQLYARRPLCDAGYYEQFNRDNVEVVSLHETPIDQITPSGILTTDGKEREVDMLIFATGFDAVDGNYTRLAIQGRSGQSLKDHWADNGPTSYLGTGIPSFPNLFMLLGPNGPFCNIPPAIETQVEFVSAFIEAVEHRKSASGNERHDSFVGGEHATQSNRNKGSGPVIEATAQAEEDWTTLCDEVSKDSLFRKTNSWIFGSNVPGKKHAVMFYFGGLRPYREILREVQSQGWKGFTIT